MKKYHVIIVGAGPSGLFCDYKLIKENPTLKILMLEKTQLKKGFVLKEQQANV